MNFSLSANMSGFCSDSHIYIYIYIYIYISSVTLHEKYSTACMRVSQGKWLHHQVLAHVACICLLVCSINVVLLMQHLWQYFITPIASCIAT